MPLWHIDGDGLRTRRRSGGAIAIGGFEYQKSYTCHRLFELLDQNSELCLIRYEGAQDIDLLYENHQEYLQIKNTPDIQYGLDKIAEFIACFIIDFVDANEPDDLFFGLVLRGTSFKAATQRVLFDHAPTEADIERLADVLGEISEFEAFERDRLKHLIRAVIPRITTTSLVGDIVNGEWSFDFLSEKFLADLGISDRRRREDALNLLKSKIRPRASFSRETVMKLLSPYLDQPAASTTDTPALLAPRPSRHFVGRLKEIKEICASLCRRTETETPTPIVGLTGMPGVGKSSLAMFVASHPDIRAVFPDGVLWVTLGQSATLETTFSYWIMKLGGKFAPNMTVPTMASELRALLANRRMLIVIDDLWFAEQGECCRIAGPTCATLVTSRNVGLVSIVGGTALDVGVLPTDEAMALFLHRLNIPTGDVDEAVVKDIVGKLGCLPLAIEICAAQVGPDYSLDDLAVSLSEEISRLNALDLGYGSLAPDDAEQHRQTTLEASFALSVRLLLPSLREGFAWLGVLVEDAVIRSAIAAPLWESTVPESGRRLRALRRHALLLDALDISGQPGGYRMHDLLRDYALKLLRESPEPHIARFGVGGLGLTVREAHDTYLQRLQVWFQADDWAAVPTDGYVQRHLVHHLRAAERFGEIHKLLLAVNGDGRNAWFETRNRMGDIGPYAQDLAIGQEVALSEQENEYRSLARAAHYTVARASITARRLHPALIATAIERGVWTPDQALAYIRVAFDDLAAASALVALAPHLGTRWKTEICHEFFERAFNYIVSPKKFGLTWIDPTILESAAELLPDPLLDRLVAISENVPVESQAEIAAAL